MSRRITLAASACFAVASAISVSAQAQTFYLGAEGGWNVLEDQTDRGPAGTPNIRAKFSDGWAAGARAGYEMGPWRFEEEYTYRSNDLSGLRIGPTNRGVTGGDRTSHAIMTNVLYDINFGNNFGLPITPHIGAGIGAVNVSDSARIRGAGQIFNDNDWVFGYQAIGGIRYNINPALAFDLDYRYLGTTEASFKVPRTNVSYKSDYENHTLMASLVYRFGAPPPPVAAAPAPPIAPPPATQRTFIVFFDWDKATITNEGMQIIRQAADAFRSGAPVRIQVTGYTDRSGSPGYNQRLSERRANAVASALTRLGVPRDQMAVSGRGENDNRVPTASGVREPQNRRVEIVFM